MKNSYILLRNNTESAPLYAEDLQRIGLKATDLIWVECQSVCWQNPHEIPELRPLVSAQSNIVQEKKVAVTTEVQVQHAEAVQQIPAEKKDVFVKLPADEETLVNNNTVNKETVKPVPDFALSDMEKYGGITSNTDFSMADKKEVAAKTNYSRSLDDIKEMYVKNLEGKKKNVIEIRLPPQTKKIALYTSLVTAGALMMLLIKSFTSEKPPVAKAVPPQQEPAPASAMPQPVYEMQTDSTAITESLETVKLPVEEADITEPERQQPRPVTNNKPSAPATQAIKEDEKMETTEASNGKVEKYTRPASETKAVKPVPMDEIASRLTLTANEYNVGSFGGIRNLKMTLQNDSKYLLDKVTVEIQYLNPEGIIIKTDNIYFQSLPPGDKATIAVDKTKRGVKVVYKIVRIDPKETGHAVTKATGDKDYTNK